MKKFKKIVSMILMGILITGICGCKEEKVTQTTDENGKYIVPDKKLELTVWETQGTDYAAPAVDEKSVVRNWLEEKTNVTVKNMYGNGGGQWDSKLAQLVAGNNLPHIIHCGAYQGPAHFNKVKKLKKLYTLTPDIIKKYAPNLWERTPKKFWDAMTDEDGNILGIPYYNSVDFKESFSNMDEETADYIRSMTKSYQSDVAFSPKVFLWARDDIIQKFFPEAKSYDECVALLNEKQKPIGDDLLDIPIKSTEDYLDFLYKVKDANIKEDGKKVYPIGYSGGDNWYALTWLGADMIGYKCHNYAGTYNYKTKKYELMLVHDTIKEAAKLQNKLVNDEVIESESLVQTPAQYKEKVLNGQYAIVSMNLVGGNPDKINEELERIGKKFRYRPFITLVPNKEEYPAFTEQTLWGDSICFTTELSEEEVYQTLNWINVQYGEEFNNVQNWGPESAGLYTEDENGKPIFKDERFNKYFIEGDKTALESSETKGIGQSGSLLGVYPLRIDKYNPVVVHRSFKYTPRDDSGFKFAADSEHVKNVIQYPPTAIWSSIYADIDEVVDFWGSRDQWESKIKIAIAAQPDEFDKKWEEMIDTVNEIIDVKAFEEKTTKAVKEYLSNQ